MQLNVLDDLAEAMKALDGNKQKITEIDRAVIPSEVLDWNLIRHNFSNLETFPRTPPNND